MLSAHNIDYVTFLSMRGLRQNPAYLRALLNPAAPAVALLVARCERRPRMHPVLLVPRSAVLWLCKVAHRFASGSNGAAPPALSNELVWAASSANSCAQSSRQTLLCLRSLMTAGCP